MTIYDFYENSEGFKTYVAKVKVLLILQELTKRISQNTLDPNDLMAYIGDGLVHMENEDFFGTEGMNI